MNKKDFFILSIIYSASHFWILLNHGFYWDDWVWSNNHVELVKALGEIGLGPISALMEIFVYESPIFISKLTIFLLYLGSGLILRKILDHINGLVHQEKFYLSAFFLIAPLNMARSSLCTANNALNLFLFFVGGLLVFENKTFKYNFKMLGACICFFLSYFTNSLVPFMSVIYLVLLLQLKEKYSYKQTLYHFFKNNFVYIALPLIFWAVKLFYFKPYGLYTNYNIVHLPHFEKLFKEFYFIIKTSFAEPILYSLHTSLVSPSTVFTIFLVIVLLKLSLVRKNINEYRHVLINLMFGFFCFFIAIFPYIAVGKTPFINATESRHQLLVPLGFSLIILYSFLFISNQASKKALTVFGSIVILLFTMANFHTYMEFQKMHYKEQALMREFERNPIYRQHSIFLIDDQAKNLMALGYVSRYSDFSGMFFKVFNDQTRAAANSIEELRSIMQLTLEHKTRFKMHDVQNHAPEIKITIKTKEYLNTFKTFTTLLSSLYSYEEYLHIIDNIMIFKYETL